jgi:hypothetical protein
VLWLNSKTCGGVKDSHWCRHGTCVGFQILGRYGEHKGAIRDVVYHQDKDCYVSVDELGIHSWKMCPATRKPGNTQRIPFQCLNFVTCMAYASGPKLVACACLDGCLRLYKHDLKVKSVLPWDDSIVFDMHYISKTNEIVVAGINGIRVRSVSARFRHS